MVASTSLRHNTVHEDVLGNNVPTKNRVEDRGENAPP